MKATRPCKLSHRLKIYMLLCAAACMILLNQTVFSSWHETKNDDINLHHEQTKEDVRRISSHFASFQRKFDTGGADYYYGMDEDSKSISEDTIHKETQLSEAVTVKDNKVYPENDFHNYFKINNKTDHELVNKHRYQYIVNNKYACNGDVFVVILIHSDPKKDNERKAIRDTWGAVNFHSGATIVTMFLLAETDDKNVQEKIKVESETYLDIVQGKFLDSYKNLTIKCVMGLHWVENFCAQAKFVLKVDDDTMVDVYHLVDFLLHKSPDGNIDNFLYCSPYKNQGPVKYTDSKWFVSKKEYPFEKYPHYCEGFAFLMTRDVTKKLYKASRNVQFYWIDDVYLTGLVALKAGITHHDMERGHAYSLMDADAIGENVKSVIFLLAKYSSNRNFWDQAWKDVLHAHKIR
ncbi:hypothetical protein ACF0H5_000794 [Mactra antiquata]